MFNKSESSTPLTMYEKRLAQMKEIVYKWNITEMHDYVMCKNKVHICNFIGFEAILDKFNNHRTEDKDFPKGRREFEIKDMPDRLKKAINLVLILCRHPRSNLRTMKSVQKFIKIYMDVVIDYDKKTSQKNREKLLHSLRRGLYKIETNAKQKRRRG